MTTPTIPHGYRLVSGPHTAAEVAEGWTICAEWARKGHHKSTGWHPRSGCLHDKGEDYPEPPEPNYHNRATRREYERKQRRFWRDVRRDGAFAVRALRGGR